MGGVPTRSLIQPSCFKKGQLWEHTTLLRALPSKVLKTSQDGDYITSLGKCCHNFLMMKKVFLTYSLNFSWFHLCHLSLILTGTGCPQKLSSPHLCKYSKPNRQSPGQPAPVEPAWAEGLGQMIWRSPFQPQWSCDSVIISWHPSFRWKALFTTITPLEFCYILFHTM